MLKKILYLIKYCPNKYIIISFIKTKIYNLAVTKERKKLKKLFYNNIKNKKITQDWFSSNAFHFFKEINKYKKNFSYLEIGSFEGSSALFVLKNFNKSIVFCVDKWNLNNNYISHEKKIIKQLNLDFKKAEENFDYNLHKFRNRYKKFKMESKIFFKTNNKKFDIIYIDGSHSYSNFKNDLLKSWKILKKNGLLIVDDIFWNEEDKKYIQALQELLMNIKLNYKILRTTNTQCFIKKLVEI
jgi:predicted O-methyltransferase YrrM